jgi:hypothetical protein
MLKRIATDTMEGKRNTEDYVEMEKEVEEGLNINVIKTSRQCSESVENGGRLLEANVHNGL